MRHLISSPSKEHSLSLWASGQRQIRSVCCCVTVLGEETRLRLRRITKSVTQGVIRHGIMLLSIGLLRPISLSGRALPATGTRVASTRSAIITMILQKSASLTSIPTLFVFTLAVTIVMAGVRGVRRILYEGTRGHALYNKGIVP